MNKWIEILIEISGFLVLSYILFYKSWLKSLGSEMAKLLTRKDLVLIEENVKKNFNEKLEELKSTLAKNNISHQIEFDYLHRRQAEAAVEIYQKLQELHSAAVDGIKSCYPEKPDPVRDEEVRRQRLHNTINDFQDYFVKNKIFFPESFCKEIKEILKDYWRKSLEYSYMKKINTGEESQSENHEDFIKEINHISKEINDKIPKQLDKIEKRIRSILKIEE